MPIYKDHSFRSGASAQGDDVYEIDQSIRFNDGDSPYMTRTPSSAGNRKKFTFSVWFKLGDMATTQRMFLSARNSDTTRDNIMFNQGSAGDYRIYFDARVSGSAHTVLEPTRALRDPSAWYHLVVVVDSANAVSSNRVKMYLNGERETVFTNETYPGVNQDFQINHTVAHSIGRFEFSSPSGYWDGYMTEIILLDGYAYGPEYFGTTNSSGIWIPIDYNTETGNYGTNGFKIDGSDSATLGKNVATGNTYASYTSSGLAAHDQVTDTPNVNFCTINPLYRGSSATAAHYGVVSNGNLFIEHNGASDGGQLCTQQFASGKWYWEVYIKAGGNNSAYQLGSGIAAPDHGYSKSDGRNEGARTGEIGFNSYTGAVKFANSTTKTYTEVPFLDTNIIQVAVDADNGAIYYGKNGTFMGSGDPTSGASKTNAGATWTPASYSNGWIPTTYVGGGSVPEIFINFGQEGTFGNNTTAGGNSDGNGIGNFKYSVPSGYLALCTSNLFRT